MPYDRDQVVASVTDFYTFLTTHLHFCPSDLKTPGPAGWPHIDAKKLAFSEKTDTAIELLQHLPYLECYPEGVIRKEIWPGSVCADYSDTEAIRSCARFENMTIFEPIKIEEDDDCPWEIWNTRREDVVALVRPEVDYEGDFMFVDTREGKAAIWVCMTDDYREFESVGECLAHVRRKYEELEVFPGAQFGTVSEFGEKREGHRKFKNMMRSLGWPPTQEGSRWDRDVGMKEVKTWWHESSDDESDSCSGVVAHHY